MITLFFKQSKEKLHVSKLSGLGTQNWGFIYMLIPRCLILKCINDL